MDHRLPAALLDSLQGLKGYDPEAFRAVHQSGVQVTSVRVNPAKSDKAALAAHFAPLESGAVPWSRYGLYLHERPSFTFDPWFHAGTYYVQEASSMFVEQALKVAVDTSKPLKVLDLCASPGGKSTHLQSLLTLDSFLVSNEVIRSRTNVLRDNIVKWGGGNVVVTHNDPADLAALPGFFDVMVVDAPCSGSGLFRREPEAVEEWSEGNVVLCGQRQQRILADAWPSLKAGGVLIYSTCSYSKAEDEEILQWIIDTLDADGIRIPLADAPGVVETAAGKAYGYRFWPDQVLGEGFFLCCLRKRGETEGSTGKIRQKINLLTAAEKQVVGGWMDTDAFTFMRHEQTVYAWPLVHIENFTRILQQLRVLYSGIRVGELMRDKLVPDHALAMSGKPGKGIVRAELDLEGAIAFLQRKDLPVQPAGRGWQLAAFEGHSLGWMNVLPNRVNNYYPREFRILKEGPGPGSGKNSTSLYFK